MNSLMLLALSSIWGQGEGSPSSKSGLRDEKIIESFSLSSDRFRLTGGETDREFLLHFVVCDSFPLEMEHFLDFRGYYPALN
jgi:hypothetical protein